jgi:PAS domain S-box-containing protein
MSLPQRTPIVVVNDDKVQRTVLTELLVREGYAVTDFPSAETALVALQQSPPALLVTDLYMPGVDGWRFCRLLRSPEYPALNTLPILVVSATFSGTEPETITANLGANAFLSAPVDGRRFLDVVHQLLVGQSHQAADRVLIIEDDLVIADLLAQSFSARGYVAQVAGSGKKAREALTTFLPNLIVLDYHLPDTDASILLAEFHSLEPAPAIVVMTGDTNPTLALQVMKLGARGYVRKPFEPAYLVEICEHARRESALLRVEDLLEKRTRQLQASEERYRMLVENIPGAVFHCECQPPWRMNHVSQGVRELTGYPADRFLKAPQLAWQDLIVPDDLPLVTEQVKQAMDHRRAYATEYRIQHADGRQLWVLEHGQAVLGPNGDPLCLEGVILDISARKQAEQTAASALASLSESEAKFRTLAESAPFAIMIHKEGKWVYANPAGEQITGYGAAELTRMNFWECIHPAEREKIRHDDQERQLGKTVSNHADYRLVSKDGAEKIAHVTSVLISFQSQPAVLVSMIDLSERRRLMEQLEQAQKMEAVGRLAGGVAHDFNNLLTAIKGNVSLAQDILSSDHEAQEYLHEIDLSANRASSLTRQLLAFSRKQLIQPKITNLNDLVKNFRSMLTRLIGEDVQLRFDLAQDILPVKVDAGQIEQILLNLAVNARDAMPKGGTLSILTTNVRLDQGFGGSHLGLQPGSYVKLTVADTGNGMTEEIRRHLFEPFFTTKPVGQGTGLGLATVYSAVRQNGGAIEVESETGRGASFFIYLPEASAAPYAKAGSATAEHSLHGRETILLAEDDASIRLLTRKYLERHGYQVITCADGIEAMKAAAKHEAPIQLLVTDVIMPNMNGRELHDRLSATHPAMRTLFVSGYTGDVIAQHGVLDSGVNFLPKPCDPREMLQRIRAILDLPAPGA